MAHGLLGQVRAWTTIFHLNLLRSAALAQGGAYGGERHRIRRSRWAMNARHREEALANWADHFVVYRSKDDDGRYVAHSVRTDQIGIDETVVGAVHELYTALRALIEEAQRDPNVVVFQQAPEEVVNTFLRAPKLRDDLWAEIRTRIHLPKLPKQDDDYWEPDLESQAQGISDVDLGDSDSCWRDVAREDVLLEAV